MAERVVNVNVNVADMPAIKAAILAAYQNGLDDARAPFLALADEWDAESARIRAAAEAMQRTDENVRHHAAAWRHARVASHHAGEIRQTAEQQP